MLAARIIEVGPRDGLQNESAPVSTDLKLQFIQGLLNAGLKEIEATSFVSPKWVPQLADSAELWSRLPAGGTFSALVPNLKGLERAREVGCNRIAVFTATSDKFTEKNMNQTVEQTLDAFGTLVKQFRNEVPHGFVRGYVSTAFECPYAGRIAPERTLQVAQKLLEIGVDELSFGDTIGTAVPREVVRLAKTLEAAGVEPAKVVWHFHDTWGTAIANASAALDLGYNQFDSSAAGLGGCPYAPGAGGNLATEDLVYFLERSGVSTGVDLDALSRASESVLAQLGRNATAKAQLATRSASRRPSSAK